LYLSQCRLRKYLVLEWELQIYNNVTVTAFDSRNPVKWLILSVERANNRGRSSVVLSEALSGLSSNCMELFCILAAGIRGPNRKVSVRNGVPRNTSPWGNISHLFFVI
jgi:hypothetical protein